MSRRDPISHASVAKLRRLAADGKHPKLARIEARFAGMVVSNMRASERSEPHVDGENSEQGAA